MFNMSTIWVLKKSGGHLKVKVKETTSEVWAKLNGEYDPNIVYNFQQNRDFMLLTDEVGNCLIFHKRFLWKVTE